MSELLSGLIVFPLVVLFNSIKARCQRSIFQVTSGPIWSVNNVVFILLELDKGVLVQQMFLVVVVLSFLLRLRRTFALVAVDDVDQITVG